MSMAFTKKGAERIQKVVGAFTKHIEELAQGIAEVQEEISSNDTKLGKAREVFETLETNTRDKNGALEDNKDQANKIKMNIEKLLK
jgi:chromosome segregation ATPase